MKVLLDTCVVVDVLQNRQPFAADAQGAFLAVAARKAEGFLTAKSITDIYYLTRKQTHDENRTREILGRLFSLFKVADSFGEDCVRAVSSEIPDYEDAVMSETASREGFDFIVTRNAKDYRKSKVKVISPKEFLNLMK